MIRRLWVLTAGGTDPYENLAQEELLLGRVREGEATLYLWQNAHTVVIGRNQNPWKECRTALLEAEGGRLARRLSGGGAVYHDLGNLNFTFLLPPEDYDVPRQLGVIEQALQRLGIPARATGRNDLALDDGRKVSGSAFYRGKTACYHHGTLMLAVDLDRLSRYLSPSKAKLASKGVRSVRARVANLTELAPTLTLETLITALIAETEKACGCPALPVHLSEAERRRAAELRAKYAGEHWLWGRKLDFSLSCEERFSWGGAELQLQIRDGRIEQACMYTDAMDESLAPRAEAALSGQPLHAQLLCQQLRAALPPQIASDLAALLQSCL